MVYTKENPPVVERNGIFVNLTEATFGKTSPLKGQKFWTLEQNAENAESVTKFTGEVIQNNVMTSFFRRVAIGIWTDEKNKNTDGTINMDAILADWAEFDTGNATKSDILEQLNSLGDEQMAILETIDEEGLLSDEPDDMGRPTPKPECKDRYIELSVRSNEITRKAKPLKLALKGIEAKYAAIAAKRAASKEAQPAK